MRRSDMKILRCLTIFLTILLTILLFHQISGPKSNYETDSDNELKPAKIESKSEISSTEFQRLHKRQGYYFCDRCNCQDHHESVLNHPKLCHRSNVDLLVLVKSRVQNHERRLLIRTTWGLENRFEGAGKTKDLNGIKTMKILFVMGKSGNYDLDQAVHRENQIYEVRQSQLCQPKPSRKPVAKRHQRDSFALL